MSGLLLLGLSVAAMAWLLSGAVRLTARRVGLLDIPNARSSHSVPTPRGGGIGIALAVVAGLALAAAAGLPLPSVLLPVIGTGGVIISIVSFIDDQRGLPALLRLGVHVAAAGLAVALTWPAGGVIGATVALAWIAGFTNAYNFMDGIDGLAGGQGVIAGVSWAACGWVMDRPELVTMGIVLAGASAGFVAHNWPPARLFMGDVGSAFLGFTIAVLPLAAREPITSIAVVGVLCVWPFVFDTAFTLLRRIGRGDNITEAHRTHLYQRLGATGWPHATVTSLYLGLSSIGAAMSVAIAAGAPVAWPAAGLYVVASPIAVASLVRYREARA